MKNLKLFGQALLICALFGFVATGCAPKPQVETPPSEQMQMQEQPTENTAAPKEETTEKKEETTENATPAEKTTETKPGASDMGTKKTESTSTETTTKKP